MEQQDMGALFFSWESTSLTALREDTRRAMRNGAALERFWIAAEEVCFPGVLEGLLRREQDIPKELERQAQGAEAGRLRCVALWNEWKTEGILYHRAEGLDRLAYLPVIAPEQLERERRLARALTELSQSAKGIRVQGASDWAAKSIGLDGLLRSLGERLE